MAALVQTFPRQTSTVAMLHTRPSSASGMLPNSSQGGQAHPQFQSGQSQMNRNSFHGMNNITNYRGHTSTTPITPYNFAVAPQPAISGKRHQGPHLRQEHRTISAPVIPSFHGEAHPVNRSRYPAALSVSTTSSSSSDLSSNRSAAKDDATLNASRQAAPPIFSPVTNSSSPAVPSPTKPTPDRYRRPNNNRRAESTTTVQSPPSQTSLANMPNVMQFYGTSTQQSLPVVQFQGFNSQNLSLDKPSFTSGSTADDMHIRRNATQEQSQKYRRRSIHTIDVTDYAHHGASPLSGQLQGSRQLSSANGRIDHQQHPLRSSPVTTVPPAFPHGRTGSSDSANSSRSHRSRPSSATNREPGGSMIAHPTPSSSSSTSNVNASNDQVSSRIDQPRLINIPARASSTDAAKRVGTPSPLSKPVTMNAESTTTSKDSFASAVNAALQQPAKPMNAQAVEGKKVVSPAAQQLAALNDKEAKKSKTSRLRRAFSFGSAQELRRASAENNAANSASQAEKSKLRKDQPESEQDVEQARIAAQQEAGGIGSGIYSGQGNYFGGSTDNISISSTASSASIMIRKMGKGMKKSTRSLVGLFRPKSVIGVPAADGPVSHGSQAQVSMVTVEAEREKVNVNIDPHDQAGGGTGYPKLEMNSLDAPQRDRLGSTSTENSAARRSIHGGERERAEVLAAVKKGILKRTDSANSSPVIRPLDGKNFQLPQIPNMNNSPLSSAPSTPTDESRHKKNGSVTLGGEDYFMSALRFQGDSKSVPTTPQGSVAKRNATFSPRIQFHDTWPSGEYDRRGEIATCNRLTPMLAQQIKEELNTFKMEMEVHENSKIYTHFF